MADYNLTKMALNMFCPGNEVKLDDAGLPSIMVYIPAFKNSDVLTGGDDNIHPAFIVNGKQIPGFYYSKYQNVVHDGKAYSLPAEDPQANVSVNESRVYCEDKGYGWHLSTAAEWAAIALWCKKNGFLPYGNNDNGKDSRESSYKAIPVFIENGKTGRVATGTGPLTWSHDGTASGIWDMNGNVWEFQGGIRVVWGELQILANNDAADPDNPQNTTSTCWKAINAADGTLVEPESVTTDTAAKTTGNTVKLDFVNDVWTFSTGITNSVSEAVSCSFAAISCTTAISDVAKILLRSLALLPDEGAGSEAYEGDLVYWDNSQSEQYVCRGCHWTGSASAGVFSLYGGNTKLSSGASIGFRSAYIPYM